MNMHKLDRDAKKFILKRLKQEGYPTYAKILSAHNVHTTEVPNKIAWMNPSTGSVYVNLGVDETTISVLVRHEILHDYLRHEMRLLNHLAKKRGIDRDTYTDMSLAELDDELRKELYQDATFNIAADYEISNRGYTEKDKNLIRNIIFNGRTVSGLVTEDDHPDWIDLSVEEMYDKLLEEREELMKNQVTEGILIDETTFVDPMTGQVFGI